jgi:hypothetical protein
MLSELHRHLQSHLSHVTSAVHELVAAVVPGPFGGGDVFVRQGTRPGRTVIIPGQEMDPKAAANAEEDLNVMARILEKALASRDNDRDERRAMGISLSMAGPSSGAPRNLYLDGYGAVFFLDVKFPLMPPPRKEEEPKAKEPVSSEWEEARHELDASHSPDWRGNSLGKRGAMEYDAERVEELKDAILESLKNATHIRDLKADESITVVVTGGAGSRPDRRATRKTTTDGRNTLEEHSVWIDGSRAGAGRGEATLTLRVKKSDADAFAKGKLDLDEFRKRAITRVY